ncbi:MAG: carbohydrate kinase [Saprospiraceae bacterium]|nr:carbohydrate kinase [Saprospiraceae bacterium]
MKNRRGRPIDIICAGELLVDFISSGYAESLEAAKTFERHMGGSPANLCMNMARLGNQTSLVASVGKDDMGSYLIDFVKKTGVDCSLVRQVAAPTTLILVTRTKTVANFEAYRLADARISANQLPEERLQQSTIFHTTCFGLGKKPGQTTIMKAARRAAELGCQLSIDANYATKTWPDRDDPRKFVAEFCKLGAIVKVSEVDWERLYGSPFASAEAAAQHFLQMGASLVCVTMGGDGAFVADKSSGEFLPARKVEVKDTTGAGDAFWSGFLTAWLDGHSPIDCAKAGRSMAEIKIGHFGPLTEKVERERIYQK